MIDTFTGLNSRLNVPNKLMTCNFVVFVGLVV